MTETINTIENITEETPSTESIEPALEVESAPEVEPETFSAEYVKTLREEAAAHRVKAKRTDEANARLVQALAKADGRLIESSELIFSDELIDDQGIVSDDKVRAAIDSLIQAKPYLASRRPSTPMVQGVQLQVPDTPGLFTLIRERA